MASLSTPANMLSATAPRKDSAQSSDDGPNKQTHSHAPYITSPLANQSSADIVTNDERAKSPDLMRVLSPMRARRTPKLVNAPEIRWRLPPGLQHMPSLDSVLSSNTAASDVSNVRHMPSAPHDIALPVSSASSIITPLPGSVPEDLLVPPSTLPVPSSPLLAQQHVQDNTVINSSEQQLRLDTRFNEPRGAENPHATRQLRAHHPHLLSPVVEASSMPSIRSSIADVPLQEIGTAERRPLSDVRRQDVRIISASGATPWATVRDIDGEKRYRQKKGGREQDRRHSIREVLSRLRKCIKGVARKYVTSMAKKQVARVLARVL